jgi:hypothetical protein
VVGREERSLVCTEIEALLAIAGLPPGNPEQ